MKLFFLDYVDTADIYVFNIKPCATLDSALFTVLLIKHLL